MCVTSCDALSQPYCVILKLCGTRDVRRYVCVNTSIRVAAPTSSVQLHDALPISIACTQ